MQMGQMHGIRIASPMKTGLFKMEVMTSELKETPRISTGTILLVKAALVIQLAQLRSIMQCQIMLKRPSQNCTSLWGSRTAVISKVGLGFLFSTVTLISKVAVAKGTTAMRTFATLRSGTCRFQSTSHSVRTVAKILRSVNFSRAKFQISHGRHERQSGPWQPSLQC